MTNEQFIAYLTDRLAASRRDQNDEKLDAKERAAAKTAEGLIVDSLRIMRNSAGPAARRYKRDYLRRLAKAGVKL